MRKLLSLSLAGVFALALGACEEQPTTIDQPEVRAAHQPANPDATADLDAVSTVAARRHGFDAGDDVGTIYVEVDGSGIVTEVTGHASGLDPGNSSGYVSLFYDVESEEDGPTACEPAISDPNDPDFLTTGQMIIEDVWTVDGSGDASLGPAGTQEPVALDKIGTVSIRDTRIGNGFGTQAVVACGEVN